MPKKPLFIFLGLTLLATIGLSAFFAYKYMKAPRIEVPDFINMQAQSAKETAKSLGIKVLTTYAPSTKPSETITFQIPKAGTLVKKGSFIELAVSSGRTDDVGEGSRNVELNRKKVAKKRIKPVVPKPEPTTTGYDYSYTNPAKTSSSDITASKKGRICIDPGHQQRGDLSTEPIGPGSTISKPKVTGGAVGAVTKKPEYALMLEMSLELKKYLEGQGFEVLLTRDKNDVNISNSQRAKIASDWKADLFIRLHADSNSNSSIKGISTLYPAKSKWTEGIFQKSFEWAQALHNAVVAATGRVDRKVVSRNELSGFNWSKVPVVLIEMGFMSNPDEDRLLNSQAEQLKIIEAIGKTVVNKFN